MYNEAHCEHFVMPESATNGECHWNCLPEFELMTWNGHCSIHSEIKHNAQEHVMVDEEHEIIGCFDAMSTNWSVQMFVQS